MNSSLQVFFIVVGTSGAVLAVALTCLVFLNKAVDKADNS